MIPPITPRDKDHPALHLSTKENALPKTPDQAHGVLPKQAGEKTLGQWVWLNIKSLFAWLLPKKETLYAQRKPLPFDDGLPSHSFQEDLLEQMAFEKTGSIQGSVEEHIQHGGELSSKDIQSCRIPLGYKLRRRQALSPIETRAVWSVGNLHQEFGKALVIQKAFITTLDELEKEVERAKSPRRDWTALNEEEKHLFLQVKKYEGLDFTPYEQRVWETFYPIGEGSTGVSFHDEEEKSPFSEILVLASQDDEEKLFNEPLAKGRTISEKNEAESKEEKEVTMQMKKQLEQEMVGLPEALAKALSVVEKELMGEGVLFRRGVFQLEGIHSFLADHKDKERRNHFLDNARILCKKAQDSLTYSNLTYHQEERAQRAIERMKKN
ncbi:MAG: hypothetical protein FJZ58_03380 [Chlamydiae bacterium]|nr:hypothetical protein [Chlamydiota bacterium]